MFALGSLADICAATRDVRYGPEDDRDSNRFSVSGGFREAYRVPLKGPLKARDCKSVLIKGSGPSGEYATVRLGPLPAEVKGMDLPWCEELRRRHPALCASLR